MRVGRALVRGWLSGVAVAVLAVHAPAGGEDARRAGLGPPVLASLFPAGAVTGSATRVAVRGRRLDGLERFVVSGRGVAVEIDEPGSEGCRVVRVRVDPGAAAGFRELRAEGPSGVSNALMVRIDTVPQVVETEPNDEPARADALAIGSAAAGVLDARDVDHYAVEGRRGVRLTLDVEARRLGTPLAPILTVLTPEGRSLLQAVEARGAGGDARACFRCPGDGPVIVQVRDSLFRGGPGAVYRLRVTEEPVAEGIFPLGGGVGETIEVTASGGSLEAPRRQRVRLPSTPGATVEPPPFEGPGGPAWVDQRLVVGEGPEVFEQSGGAEPSGATRLPAGATANGRIGAPGEVDAYQVRVRRGERVRVALCAGVLGSWLDSVVTVRGRRGNTLARNDDPADAGTILARAGLVGLVAPTTDSLLEFDPEEDGEVRVEVADRFGGGGPAFAYRLTVGGAEPDFAASFVLAGGVAAGEPAGVLNLEPGSSRRINVLIGARGRPGPIVVRAEGLPPGVEADPVTVRPAVRGGAGPASAVLTVRAALGARPARATVRVVARGTRDDGTPIERLATTWVVLKSDLEAPLAPVRPVVLERTSVPIQVVEPVIPGG